MQPFNLGGEMIRSVALDRTSWNELPYKFEAGTPAIAEAYGFGVAIDYVSRGRARRDRAARARAASCRRWSALAEIAGMRIFGPPADRRTGIVSFELENVHPHDVAQILNWENVAVRAGHHCTQPLMTRLGVAATTRASFYLYSRSRGRRPADRRPAQGEGDVRCLSLDQMYREVILDHYKNPRGHGVIEDADAQAEGQNPLCGDEVTISVKFAADGETIDEIGFEGRGCAISQAATSMLTEIVVGRKADEVAALPKEELLEEIGIPLTPIRLKCAILGLGVLKVALHRAKGTPLPEEWQSLANELRLDVD